jgi:cytochrome c oxidase subunit 2
MHGPSTPGSVILLRRVALLITTSATLGVSACSTEDSILDPASPSAEDVADLSWILFGAATAVTVLVFVLLGFGLARRRRRDADPHVGERGAERWVIGGGVILPIVVLPPILAMSVGILDDESEGTLRVEVVGHQFWWEYRFPDLGFATANELHIPVGEDVELTLRSDDVIHSIWVPQLGGKRDLVPGQVNNLTWHAEAPGVFQGKCAEFCGIQHAKMEFLVVAEAPEDFDAWVALQRSDADPAPAVAEGARLFATQGCAACHTIRGTGADGTLGPDLTHLASRRTLGSGVLDNTFDNLFLWIDETWEVKEEITMRPIPLTDEQVSAIAAYLETLE